MSRAVMADGRPVVIDMRHPAARRVVHPVELPHGVTETFSQVTYRTIERGGANVYTHAHNTGEVFCIDGLSRDEALRLMVLLHAKAGMEYVGVDLARCLGIEAVEETK